jgi:hypothetical protein
MPKLTPVQLQAARVASGRLGGRPRKPTVEEARQAALEELVPSAIKSLKAHLGDGDPDAWRAALRVFEHAFGRAPEQIEEMPVISDPDDIANLSWQQMRVLAASLVGPADEENVAVVVEGNGTP